MWKMSQLPEEFMKKQKRVINIFDDHLQPPHGVKPNSAYAREGAGVGVVFFLFLFLLFF